MDLKDWIKQERLRRGWTQEQLADEAGLDRVEVNALEKGRNKGSSGRVRDALTKAFGSLPVEYGGTIRIVEDHQGEAREPRWRTLPWWDDVVTAARQLFPKTSALAFERLGNLMGSDVPPQDAAFIGTMATLWDQRAGMDERSDAIVENAKREMAEEDELHAKAQLLKKSSRDPANDAKQTAAPPVPAKRGRKR